MLTSFVLTAVILFLALSVSASGDRKYSEWMLESIIARGEGIESADGLLSGIQKGIFQEALRAAIKRSNDSSQQARWLDYHKQSLSYRLDDFLDPVANSLAPLDRLCVGVSIMRTEATDANFDDVLTALRNSLDLQNTNANGGWWYFTAPPPPYMPYPNLSYSDGMYAVAPFVVLYGQLYPYDTTINISTALKQLDILYAHAKWDRDGLLLHGYDASRAAPWADSVTGASAIVWGRSMAWYMIGILNALEVAAQKESTLYGTEYVRMKAIFQELAHGNLAALQRSKQDTGRYGVWQVVDNAGEADNFIEASASAMMVYILAKGIRLGYIDPILRPYGISSSHKVSEQHGLGVEYSNESHQARDLVNRLYEEVVKSFVVQNSNSTLEFHGTSALSSLHVIDPDYKYYTHRAVTDDSLIGESAFVLASLEIEQAKAYQFV